MPQLCLARLDAIMVPFARLRLDAIIVSSKTETMERRTDEA